MSFTKDRCLSIFGSVYETGRIVFPPQARVLEIGCSEADWMTPMLELRPDLQMTGIDWRTPEWRPGTVLQGDVLTHDFPAASFDAIVGISSIEHIGLGHYDHDPIDVDGDRHCCQRIATWLKPGGIFYADVPYASQYRVHGTEYRVYDERAFCDRLVQDLTLRGVWYANWQGTPIPDPPPTDPNLLGYVALVATKDR